MSKFFNLISTHFEWVLELLNSNTKQSSASLSHYYYSRGRNNSEEQEDCSICLAKIQQRQQVTKLRCNHFFHRVCLDQWFGSGRGRLTCPLCRDNLAPAQTISTAAGDDGAQVLELRFMSTSLPSLGDRDSFWLR
ncbi:Probable E3 ubiquitin-protein ligase XERICO [Linum grandiflorum]